MSSSETRSAQPGADLERQPAPPESPEELAARVARLLPLLRFNPGTRLLGANPWRFGLALFPEGPVVFRTRRERFIPEAAFEPGGRAALLEARGIRVRLVATWEEIDEVRAVQTNWSTVRFTFRAGTRTKASCHEITECGHLFDALTVLLGPRFHADVPRERLSRRWVPSRLGPSMVVALVVSAGMLWFGGLLAMSPAGWLQHLGFAALLLGFLCAARVEAEWGRWLTRRLRSRRPAGVPPYRSRKLGFSLKFLGLGLLAALNFAPWNAIIAYAGPNPVFTFFREPNFVVLLLLMATALKALDVGHRLALRSSENLLKHDARAPVVFLRSFEDDGVRNLNPDSQAARWLGLRGWFETGRGIVASLVNVYPLRILRLSFGTSAETAEEQIARHLRKTIGPVVAIGRPGERVAHAGAARMYVTHDEWQQRVLDMLARCQAVVLQPSETRGVWWEVDRCIERLERRQILLSLVSFMDSAQAFEVFRLKWEDRTGTRLPRRRGDALFWRFGEDWTPIPIALSESSPWLWPLTGSGIDWIRTLGPFTAGIGNVTPSIPSQPPHRTRRAAPAAVAWAAAGGVWIVAQLILLDPWLEARAIASRSGSEWSPALVRVFGQWQPHGRWSLASQPRPGFQWEVESNGGRYSAALAYVAIPADAAASGSPKSGILDFFRLHPGKAVLAGDGGTWMEYGLSEGPVGAWGAPPRSHFVCVESHEAWIIELDRPPDAPLIPPGASAAVLDSILDMQSIRPLRPEGPTPKSSLPSAWWAHYLAQRPPNPGCDLVITAGDEWSLALDPTWREVSGRQQGRQWHAHSDQLELGVWSEPHSSDLGAIVDQVLGSLPGKVLQKADSAGMTGDAHSSRDLTVIFLDHSAGAFELRLVLLRSQTSVHYLSVKGPERNWSYLEADVQRALDGFLMLAEPYRP